jgi:hypothetical protein
MERITTTSRSANSHGAQSTNSPCKRIPATPTQIPFTESLGVGIVIRIDEFFATLLPRRSQLRRCDVRPTLLADAAGILAEIFHCGPTEEPVAVVILVMTRPANSPVAASYPRMITALQRCRNREQPVVTTRRAPIVVLRCIMRRYAVIAPIDNTLRKGKWTPRRQADRGLATATHPRKLQKCGACHRLFDCECQGTVVCRSLSRIRR